MQRIPIPRRFDSLSFSFSSIFFSLGTVGKAKREREVSCCIFDSRKPQPPAPQAAAVRRYKVMAGWEKLHDRRE